MTEETPEQRKRRRARERKQAQREKEREHRNALEAAVSRMADYGPERLCTRCDEWWPADEEFFSRLPSGKLRSICKACRIAVDRERQEARHAHQPR